VWLIFADKHRWRSLITISAIALLLALIAQIIAQKHPTWDYVGEIDWTLISISNDSVYMVTTYLFIQWYPYAKRNRWIVSYWVGWTTYALVVEYVYWELGHLVYYPNWSLSYSYILDWILFGFFYKYYTIFKLSRLDKKIEVD
jgi:hypothetical protein